MIALAIFAATAYGAMAIGFALLSLHELGETGRTDVMSMARALSWAILWPLAIAMAMIAAGLSAATPRRAGRP